MAMAMRGGGGQARGDARGNRCEREGEALGREAQRKAVMMVPAENEFLGGGALNCELITSLCGRSWRSDHAEPIMPSWCK